MSDKFITTIPDLAETSAHGPWKCLVIGKPLADTNFGQNAGECGTYYDGLDYTSSTTFSGTGFGRVLVCADSSTKKAAKITSESYFTNQPVVGTKYTSVTLYKEDSNDEGSCAQGGSTYYKYDAVAEVS